MADFNALRRNRYSQYQNALMRILQGRQSADQSYGMKQSMISQERPKALRNLLNNFSGRGLAFSSGYGTGVSETNANYDSQAAAALADRNAAYANADLQQSAEDSAYNYDLADYGNQEAAYRAQQEQERVAALAAQQQQQAQLALTMARTNQANAQAKAAKKKNQGMFGGLRRRL